MKLELLQSEVCLEQRQLLRLVNATGVCVRARSGTLWVTQDHDLRDVILREGESFRLDGQGQAIVQALEASRIGLSPLAAVRRPPTWTHRLGQAVRCALPGAAWA